MSEPDLGRSRSRVLEVELAKTQATLDAQARPRRATGSITPARAKGWLGILAAIVIPVWGAAIWFVEAERSDHEATIERYEEELDERDARERELLETIKTLIGSGLE